jgi:glycosyltransferase involved in cell wall biosynthesis
LISNKDILFSIIIPTYNRAGMIGNAIQSVVDQTYCNWELIIVDDGSTDNTEEAVRNFKEPRIKYLKKNHEERSIARNFGIEKANGTYLSFLDDDDYYLPEFLEEFHKKITLKSSPIAVFISEEIISSGKKMVPKKFSNLLIKNKIKLIWIYEPGIRPFVIHKEIMNKINFPVEYRFGEDMHLVIRAVLNFPVFIIRKPLYVFSQHHNQGTSLKFSNNLRDNALNSLNCLNNLLSNNKELFIFIPSTVVFDKVNHIVYGFSSASIKAYDFEFFRKLIKEFSIKGSKLRLAYYFISLFVRLPYYFLISLFKK